MIFDRKWFNRLYFKWTQGLYKENPKLAEKLDAKIIGDLGKRMAQEIKEKVPQIPNEINYLFSILKESHWFQEDIEIVKKNKREIILQVKNCSWQTAWLKNNSKLYACINSHRLFLENFVKEVNPHLKVINLLEPKINPADEIYCKWRIYKK